MRKIRHHACLPSAHAPVPQNGMGIHAYAPSDAGFRIFLPYVGITVSSREQKHFRDGIVKIAATKVSAGVSTGIGDHESKYTGKESGESGDEQFEISDGRSFDQMYNDMESEGLQPVLNDYVYV